MFYICIKCFIIWLLAFLGFIQALQCSSNPQTSVSSSFSCTKVRIYWTIRKEKNLIQIKKIQVHDQLSFKYCFMFPCKHSKSFHQNRVKYQAPLKTAKWFSSFTSVFKMYVCMVISFVNMYSFLILSWNMLL